MSKAFPCTAVQAVMAQEGLGLDVAGGGEILTAIKAGVVPGLVVLHGNAKSTEELSMAVENGIGLVVVDGPDDVDRLKAIVPAGRTQDVLVRIIPGVTADTHAHVLTGHEGSKFGLAPAAAAELIRRIEASGRLAGAVPVSGSSYSYAYATIGELPAVAVAGCLLLEYGVSGSAVAVGWSQYLNQLLNNLFGFQIPESLSQAPEQGGLINLPAVILIALCALLLIRGASESATVNTVMVLIKIGVLVMFIAIGITGWNTDNLADFAPFGFSGITTAAGIIFFSYIGLDAVSTAGEEVKNPHRTMPLAIMIALVTVTGLYVMVCLVAVAAQPYTEFEGQEAGLAQILENITGSTWPGTLLAAGAVISIFSVTLVVISGQTRILFAMARDGMIPELFHKVNPRTHTPVPNTIIVATLIALLAGFIPINFLAEMTSVGTLVAFTVVSIAVMVLRARQPELPRTFKVPLYPVTPILAVLGCLWIIKDLRPVTLLVFVIWTAVVLIWYFTYGLKHSHLGRDEQVGLLRDDPEKG